MRRLAISTWTLHGELQNGLDLLHLPEQIAQRGIHELEICHFHLAATTPDYLAALRQACADAGVHIYSVLIDDGDITAPDLAQREADLQMVRTWIDIAAELGAERVRIAAGMQPPTPEVVQLSAINLSALAQYATLRGVQTITENWRPTSLDPQALLAILDGCAGSVGLCADLGNAEGPEKYQTLELLLPRASSVHFKARYAADAQLEPDDFARCIALIDAANFDGAVTVIYGDTDREWPAVEQLVAALEPHVGQMHKALAGA